jgi:hypothetical protein
MLTLSLFVSFGPICFRNSEHDSLLNVGLKFGHIKVRRSACKGLSTKVINYEGMRAVSLGLSLDIEIVVTVLCLFSLGKNNHKHVLGETHSAYIGWTRESHSWL